ncbi:MAG: TipAS antibiotic-recognition domain-containing protein [Micrococcales bacterium]|nr:TipAS antibiotic-recognition domain-containing protein [Micrococcales bacterium]
MTDPGDFDHTAYRDEVVERWGSDAYAQSAAWWEAKSPKEQLAWRLKAKALQHAWRSAAIVRTAPESSAAQALAERHVAWLRSIPGTPAQAGGEALKSYVKGLAQMYVADERFAANYGGLEGATFVAKALETYADQHL